MEKQILQTLQSPNSSHKINLVAIELISTTLRHFKLTDETIEYCAKIESTRLPKILNPLSRKRVFLVRHWTNSSYVNLLEQEAKTKHVTAPSKKEPSAIIPHSRKQKQSILITKAKL